MEKLYIYTQISMYKNGFTVLINELPNIMKRMNEHLNKKKADTQTKELQIADTQADAEICNTFVFWLTHRIIII